MAKRTYGQTCPIALTLDLLGERWTLLLVRNLLFGPKRYTDLRDGMPGIPAQALTDRLRTLQDEGLIRRRKLPPPAGSIVYELTERGRGLEEPLFALARFGVARLPQAPRSFHFRAEWGFFGFRLFFDADAARGVHDEFECRIDAEVFHMRVDDGALELAQGPARRPAVVVHTDTTTFADLATQRTTLADALSRGAWRFDGEPDAIALFARLFRPPLAS